jgi:hypothetical protein
MSFLTRSGDRKEEDESYSIADSNKEADLARQIEANASKPGDEEELNRLRKKRSAAGGQGLVSRLDLRLDNILANFFDTNVQVNYDPQELYMRMVAKSSADTVMEHVSNILTYVIKTGSYNWEPKKLKWISNADGDKLVRATKALGIRSWPDKNDKDYKWRVTVSRIVSMFAHQISMTLMRSQTAKIKTVYSNKSGIPMCMRFSGATGLVPTENHLLTAAFMLHSYRTSMITMAEKEIGLKKRNAKDMMKNVNFGIQSVLYTESFRKEHLRNVSENGGVNSLEQVILAGEGGGQFISGWQIHEAVGELVLDDEDRKTLRLMKRCYDHVDAMPKGGTPSGMAIDSELADFA